MFILLTHPTDRQRLSPLHAAGEALTVCSWCTSPYCMRLAEDRFYKRFPCIIMTAKAGGCRGVQVTRMTDSNRSVDRNLHVYSLA